MDFEHGPGLDCLTCYDRNCPARLAAPPPSDPEPDMHDTWLIWRALDWMDAHKPLTWLSTLAVVSVGIGGWAELHGGWQAMHAALRLLHG